MTTSAPTYNVRTNWWSGRDNPQLRIFLAKTGSTLLMLLSVLVMLTAMLLPFYDLFFGKDVSTVEIPYSTMTAAGAWILAWLAWRLQ
jgi:hypothetical protein